MYIHNATFSIKIKLAHHIHKQSTIIHTIPIYTNFEKQILTRFI